MMWGPRGPRGQHGVETMETTAMGTTWGPFRDYVDDVGMTRGLRGNDRDNVGTTGTTKSLKMPITFERIVIIEFCLKIWDP